MSIKFKKIAIAAMLGVSFTASAGNEFIIKQGIMGMVETSKEKPFQDSALVFGYNYNAMSSIMIGRGTYEPWCNMQHGRYNGSCLNGPVGLGNWAILVR